MNQNKVSKKEAVAELYRRANLSWKLHVGQKHMYKALYESQEHSIHVWLMSRQFGKSYTLAVIAIEHALRKKNALIKVLTDTKVHMKNVFLPIMNQILEDCPEELRPVYQKAEYTFVFPNGSQIQMAGSDGKNYERLRGQKSDLVLVDEAGFCNDLLDAVKSVLLPTTTHTGGRIVLASTPPSDPEHDFHKFIEEADMSGTLIIKTIDDNPLLTRDQIKHIEKQMKGRNTEQFRREYLCEIIKDSSVGVLPEVTEELLKDIVKEWPLPPFFDCYESMDLGFNDLTVILFGYYDFRADKIVIQDEWVGRGQDLHLNKLTDDIFKKRQDLWFNQLTNEQRDPVLSISDINYIVMEELRRLSQNKIHFHAARKDDKDAALNNLRMMLANRKIIINPKCVTLIRHLKNVRWRSNNDKRVFGRSADGGHYDAVDALLYLIRGIHYTKNPYPATYGLNTKDLYIQNPKAFLKNSPTEVYKRIFGRK